MGYTKNEIRQMKGKENFTEQEQTARIDEARRFVSTSTFPDEEKRAKPFLKWAGGKGQLLAEIQKFYCFDDENVTKYAEPFVGGGAVLFDVLSKFKISSVYISDINEELINTYEMIRDHSEDVIALLLKYQDEYLPLGQEERKKYYADMRAHFNDLKKNDGKTQYVEKAARLMFLNRTCFNGLYRVNRKGLYNVPMGAYKHPTICDEKNLRTVAEVLKNVEIVCGDYRTSEKFIDNHTLVYFDPPYRPLSQTANFTAYTENVFDDEAQKELAQYVKQVSKKGAKVIVSNSDPKNENAEDDFFEQIYSGFFIHRVEANRMINSNSRRRGKIKELLITNF